MSRHTEPMTDAYMIGLRLRNAARAQFKTEQLGDRWLLHPDNAIEKTEVIAKRRAKALRENRLLIVPNATREAFIRHAECVSQSGLLIEYKGGAQ